MRSRLAVALENGNQQAQIARRGLARAMMVERSWSISLPSRSRALYGGHLLHGFIAELDKA
jgi:hypothetical protein